VTAAERKNALDPHCPERSTGENSTVCHPACSIPELQRVGGSGSSPRLVIH
jgi:hypothetical protein